jgi:formylglycine-generating enzyme required for sulfatase activity
MSNRSTCRFVFSIAGLVAISCAVSRADEKSAGGGTILSFDGTKAGQVRDDNGLKLKLEWCPAGQFKMEFVDDKRVEVTVTHGFWIGEFEVTRSQWVRVMQSEPWRGDLSAKEGDDFPATKISWDESVAFCEKLTAQEHQAGRLPRAWKYVLPNEAQWEYACRAGSTTRFAFGDDEADLPRFAWFKKNAADAAEEFAHRVGQKRPNPWGIYDMHGNAGEWCRDAYHMDPTGDRDPLGTADPAESGSARRVFRGGSWGSAAEYCRSSYRNGVPDTYRRNALGLRIAVVPSGK